MVAAQALDDPFLALGHDTYPLEHGDQDEQGDGGDDDEAGHDAKFLLVRVQARMTRAVLPSMAVRRTRSPAAIWLSATQVHSSLPRIGFWKRTRPF
ncbi:hypothetical protein D3C80_1925080 [compost metagenome]